MKALFVADPVETLKPASDTSLLIACEILHRAHQVWFTEISQLSWEGGDLWAECHEAAAAEPYKLPELGKTFSELIRTFDFIFIRKDPPFDENYVKLCWLLAPFEKKIRMINQPSHLLRYHEKMLPLEGLSRGFLKKEHLISTCITSQFGEAVEFVEEQSDVEEIVVKPWLGYQGGDVFVIARKNFFEEGRRFFSDVSKTWIIQPCQAEVRTEGDRRVFFFQGRYIGDFVRLPQTGSIVSNLARGGTALKREMNSKELELTERLEKWLKETRIFFAGADYIAGRVNEVNITSPTGFASFEKLYGRSLAKEIVDQILESKKYV